MCCVKCGLRYYVTYYVASAMCALCHVEYFYIACGMLLRCVCICARRHTRARWKARKARRSKVEDLQLLFSRNLSHPRAVHALYPARMRPMHSEDMPPHARARTASDLLKLAPLHVLLLTPPRRHPPPRRPGQPWPTTPRTRSLGRGPLSCPASAPPRDPSPSRW